ncbi:helix-turn-helix transcriptional regulator [Actinomadura sp. CNU-125]|uniref:helix-turn-helix domain-containing protein n=1 Tax=Actinomadura sp. CNU-125 TaxID=1904961 RepID=UPI0011788322|nr:helix-turn-helix transcriptional regulator [Actinomadura sp. CNU-125]
MSTADDLDPRSSLYAWLAHDLRLYRQRHGLTGEQLGKIIGCVRSHVANIEAGRARIDMKQAKILDELWKTGGHFQTLLFFAETAHDPDWLRSYSQHEAAASVIRIYQGQIIPPPLQTEGYMRALLAESDAKDVELAIQSRMARQDAILTRPSPPYVWILMDEDSITSEIGGREAMRSQLRYLLEVGVLPHISVRIIPKSAGAHLGLDGPFRLITVRDRQIGYVGARRGGRLIEGPTEITEIAVDYERIGFKALSEDATRARIGELEATK